MSANEHMRLVVVNQVPNGEINLASASEMLCVLFCQIKPIFANFQPWGDVGVVHVLHGKASNRQPMAAEKVIIPAQYQSEYWDYGSKLSAESLGRDHEKIRVPMTTLLRWLKALRRANISELVAANEFPTKELLPAFNAQFAVPPPFKKDGHRVLPASANFSRIFSIQDHSVVQNHWPLRWNNAYLPLLRSVAVVLPLSPSITTCQPLRGPLRLLLGDHGSSYSESYLPPKPMGHLYWTQNGDISNGLQQAERRNACEPIDAGVERCVTKRYVAAAGPGKPVISELVSVWRTLWRMRV